MNEFEELLKEITKAGEIDRKIFDNIKDLKKSLNTSKDKWLHIDNHDTFYFYNAIFNIEIILDEIKNKFYNNFKTTEKNSVIAKDNPEIAMKSLILLPIIDEILKITGLYKTDKKFIESVLHKTQDLRKMAANTFLPKSLNINEDFIEENAPKFNQEIESFMGIKN